MTAGGDRPRRLTAVALLAAARLLATGACTANPPSTVSPGPSVGESDSDASSAGATGNPTDTASGAEPGTVPDAETGSESAWTTSRETSAIPGADEQAIRATIDRLNATAAGAVSDQQAALAALIDPALTGALDDCPPATTTLRMEPVYPGLRPAPDWTAPEGALGGTVYALPSLIRIYTGDRMTGTDLTTLHLGLDGGKAYLAPLCVG